MFGTKEEHSIMVLWIQTKMKTLKRYVTFLIIIIIAQIVSVKAIVQESNETDLNKILIRTAEYCENVKNMALYYVCKEKISNKKYLYRVKKVIKRNPDTSWMVSTKKLEFKGSKTKTFTYDYQLIKKQEEITEKRSLLEVDGKKNNKENSQLEKMKLKYFSKYLVYGPVGFLSKYWQKHFDYEIIGKDTVEKKEAIIIKARPCAPRQENYNIARIWIDIQNYSILRIEWESLSIRDYQEETIQFPVGEYRKTVIWNVTFGVEEKGVRFPSEQLIQEVFINENGEKKILEEIIFSYVDYKFFTVETEVKTKR